MCVVNTKLRMSAVSALIHSAGNVGLRSHSLVFSTAAIPLST